MSRIASPSLDLLEAHILLNARVRVLLRVFFSHVRSAGLTTTDVCRLIRQVIELEEREEAMKADLEAACHR